MMRVMMIFIFLAALGEPSFAKVVNWTCSFPIVANPNGVMRDQDAKAQFTLDDVTGKAQLLGDNGAIDVAVIPGDRVMTFVARLPSGGIQTTSIDPAGHGVLSRHTVLAGTLLPSVLEGVETEEGQPSGVLAGAEDAEDAALFARFVVHVHSPRHPTPFAAIVPRIVHNTVVMTSR